MEEWMDGRTDGPMDRPTGEQSALQSRVHKKKKKKKKLTGEDRCSEEPMNEEERKGMSLSMP